MTVMQFTPETHSLSPGLRLRIGLGRLGQAILCFVAGDTDGRATLEREFKDLLAKENNTISKICFSYAGSVADYEDLRQDALINIWRGLQSFRGEAKHRTWVYRVTVNSCLSTIRSQRRHKHESLNSLYGLIEAPQDDRDAIEQLYRIISSLGAQDRAIIMMWLDEMKYEDIASVMGLNRNTVATRLSRIKERIIVKFKKEESI